MSPAVYLSLPRDNFDLVCFICFFVQITLAEIRQLLVDLGVSEYGGVNSISRLGQIVGETTARTKD